MRRLQPGLRASAATAAAAGHRRTRDPAPTRPSRRGCRAPSKGAACAACGETSEPYARGPGRRRHAKPPRGGTAWRPGGRRQAEGAGSIHARRPTWQRGPPGTRPPRGKPRAKPAMGRRPLPAPSRTPRAKPRGTGVGEDGGDARGRRQKFGRHRKRRGGGASGHKDGVRQRAAHASHADLATEAATRAAARRATSRRQPEATSSPDARKKNGSGPPRPADIIRRAGATRKRPRATFQNCGRLGPSRRSRAVPPIFGARENIPPNAHDQGIWIRAMYRQDAPALHGSVL